MQIKSSGIGAVLIFYGLFCSNIATAQHRSGNSDNYLVIPAKPVSITFYWQGDTIDTKWEQYTALLLPVKFKNCPKLFYMQFDLGSPHSVFYKNKLVAIQAKYPQSIPSKELTDKLVDFKFTIDKMPILAKHILVKQYDSSTINWRVQNSVEIIGTIGADLIDGKVAMIDYPKKKLLISPEVPAKLKPRLSLSDFIYAQRRILLPATILGEQKMLYFDTGSSSYELLTDKKTAQLLAVANGEVVQSKVQSWDKYLVTNTVSTNDSMEIGGYKIAIRKATFIDGISNTQVEQMMKMGIGGMTGNKLFLGYKLVIDTKNQKFAIVSSK